MHNSEFVALLKETLAIPSPPANEEKMADFVSGKINEMGLSVKKDLSGNLTVNFEGKDPSLPKVMLAAHMDEIAMVVSKINKDGTLEAVNSGRLHPWKMGESPVDILGDNKTITGIASMGSTHRANAAESTVTWKDVKIITGLDCEGLSKAGVRIGTAMVLSCSHRGPFIFGNESAPMIGAWTFDDRAGVVNLLRLINNISNNKVTPLHPTTIAFTVQEEGGCYGAIGLAQRLNPDIFIAIDGCPVIDEDILPLDGGVGIWCKDTICNYNPDLIRTITGIANKTKIPLYPVIYESAASDASAVWKTGGAQKIAFLGHARTNSHGFEVARLSCFENVLELLGQVIENKLVP